MTKKKMSLPAAIKLSGLNLDQVKETQRLARRVWDYIAGDCLEANGGKDIPKAQVVELVLDAMNMNMATHDAAILAFVQNRPWRIEQSRALKAIGTAAFPYGRYGM